MKTKIEKANIDVTLYKGKNRCQIFIPVGSRYLEIAGRNLSGSIYYPMGICDEPEPFIEVERVENLELSRKDVAAMLRLYREILNFRKQYDSGRLLELQKGYPDELSGDEISEAEYMMAIADFEWSAEDRLKNLCHQLFDNDLMRCC